MSTDVTRRRPGSHRWRTRSAGLEARGPGRARAASGCRAPRGPVAGVRALPQGRDVHWGALCAAPAGSACNVGGADGRPGSLRRVEIRSRDDAAPVHHERRQHHPLAPRPLQRPRGPPEPGRGHDRGRRGHGAPPPPGERGDLLPRGGRRRDGGRRRARAGSAAGDAVLIPPGAWHQIRGRPARAGAAAVRVRAPLEPPTTPTSDPPRPPIGRHVSDRLIRLGHSPDPDDAFMFYALAQELIPTDGFRFEHVLRDIETLNDWAREGRLEVTALSVHAYAYLSDRYRLLPHGASMGERLRPDGGGARGARPGRPARPAGGRPGRADERVPRAPARRRPHRRPGHHARSTASSTWSRPARWTPAWSSTRASSPTQTQGLRSILDLGEWWHELTGGLPLPLGANAVRRDLDEGDTLPRLSRLLRAQHRLRPGAPRRGARARRAVRARARPGARRPLRRHVRQRPHPRLRRGRPRRRRRAAAPRPRGRPDRPRRRSSTSSRTERRRAAAAATGTAEIDRWTERFRAVNDPPEPFATALREGWTDEARAALARRGRPPTPSATASGSRRSAAPGWTWCASTARRAPAASAPSTAARPTRLAGETEGLPTPPPLPICPACRHTLNLLTPFFMQSLGPGPRRPDRRGPALRRLTAGPAT